MLITEVEEIIQYKGAIKVFSTPEYMDGITNLRGKIIPVTDMALRLEIVTAKTDDKTGLVINTAGREIGLS